MSTVGILCPAVCCRICTPRAVVRLRLLAYGINICHAWAFCVVRLDDLGNARASTSGMGKGESHAFFCKDITNKL